MRILYCIPHLYNAGGMERVLTQKVNWLATHTDHVLTIVTTERTPEGLNDVCFPLHAHVQVEALSIDFDADYASGDVWRYVYASWGYVRIYVWTDSATVEAKTCLNAYHMEREDSTRVVADRAAFHAEVVADCLYYTQERD